MADWPELLEPPQAVQQEQQQAEDEVGAGGEEAALPLTGWEAPAADVRALNAGVGEAPACEEEGWEQATRTTRGSP